MATLRVTLPCAERAEALNMPVLLYTRATFPAASTATTPPSPPNAPISSKMVTSHAEVRDSPPWSMRPWMSWVTPVRMKYSPQPVAETAHVRLSAQVPAPINASVALVGHAAG